MAIVKWDSEKELEDYLESFFKQNKSCPINGEEHAFYFRQLDISPYGVIDLVTFNYSPFTIDINIYELKKEKITISAIGQIARYRTGLNRLIWPILDKIKDSFTEEPTVNINSYLVASSICFDDDVVYVSNFLDDFHLVTSEFDLDSGIDFVNKGKEWHKSNDMNSFKNNQKLSIVIDGIIETITSYDDYIKSKDNNTLIAGIDDVQIH